MSRSEPSRSGQSHPTRRGSRQACTNRLGRDGARTGRPPAPGSRYPATGSSGAGYSSSPQSLRPIAGLLIEAASLVPGVPRGGAGWGRTPGRR